MRRLTALLVPLFAALLFAGDALTAPLSAYGQLPRVSDIEISPDGALIALSTTFEGKFAIEVRQLSDNRMVFAGALPPTNGFLTGEGKVRGVSWVDATHLMVLGSRAMSISNSRFEVLTGSLIDVRAGKVTPLMEDYSRAGNYMFGEPEVRLVGGEANLFITGVLTSTSQGFGIVNQIALFRHELASGRTTLVERGVESMRQWVVSEDGTPVGRSLYDDKTARWTFEVKDAAGRWTPIATEALPLGPPRLRGLGRDGRSVVAPTVQAAREGAAGDGSLREYSAEGAVDLPQFSELIEDPRTHRLIGGARQGGDESGYVFFDARDAAVWRAIERAYPGKQVTLESWSADRNRVVVLVDDPALGEGYALVDIPARNTRWIAVSYPDVKAPDISPRRAYRYKAQDGLEITGYLTTPNGKAAKGLPLVVMPHGGPASRDYPGFDWWAQALASRGYAVLQPNFRGSDGFGPAFLKAGYGEWGRKMQTDLSDGVQALAAEGVIDAKRVCIVGASYGGYAALAGITLQKGVYRCAVSVAGPSDLPEMLTTEDRDGSGRTVQRYWSNFMGVKDRYDAKLETLSPARYAAEADGPILLIHGRDDAVVPIEQSRLMDAALTRARKPHRLVVLDGEDHWLSRGPTRTRMLEATAEFLERENPPH